MPFKKDFSVFLLQTLWYDHCKSARRSMFSFFFVLKICTDTYKIIDKNIPLLTIRLGGKPCETWGGQGGPAGWLGVWGGGPSRRGDSWAVVLLGLGLLLGLLGGCFHLGKDEEEEEVKPFGFWRVGSAPARRRSPRWSWPLRSQSGSPRWPLPRRSPLPSWSSCPPSCHSQPFLSVKREAAVLVLRTLLFTRFLDVLHLCCLLGLWLRLRWGRFLWGEKKIP